MQIGENKVVSMTYTLKKDDTCETTRREVNEDRPFVYLFGQGGLLPAFKDNLRGLNKGDSFDFILVKEDAYGVNIPENIIDLDKKIFEVDGKVDESMLQVGKVIPMQDDKGNPLSGVLVEIGADSVKMDFNHPLAGLDLHFSGRVLDVREPTMEELDHGHAHEPGGHDH